jgi:transcriptional regulator with XRE-family HTH domain
LSRIFSPADSAGLISKNGGKLSLLHFDYSPKQLADKLDVKRSLIDYYETRSPNPSLDFIERAAAALEVTVAELLGSEPNAAKGKPGPKSQLQRKFEQVKLLPREKQKFIIQFLDTVLDSQQKQKA